MYSLERNKTRWTPPKPQGGLRMCLQRQQLWLCVLDMCGGPRGHQSGAEAEGSKVRALPGRTDGFTGYDPGQVTPRPISTLP